MIEASLRKIAEDFWLSAGIPRTFPRELERALAWVMPIAVLRIPNLWTHDVEECLRRRQLPLILGIEDRPLHGCVYAYGGKGLIIVDGTDSAEELRFTVAHEFAHFLLDYEVPRKRAIERLGPEINEVLDGHRIARVNERVDAILSAAPLGVYSHFMHRVAAPDDSAVVQSENRADRLAVELLAPEQAIRKSLPRGFYDKPFQKRVVSLQRQLKTRFGLPHDILSRLASQLCHEWFSGPSAREWLGL